MTDLISLWIESDKEYEKEFRRQELIIEVAEAVSKRMEEKQVKRSALAKLLGKTTSFVTQILTGSRNMTLSTVSDLAFALDAKVRIEISDSSDDNGWNFDGIDYLVSPLKTRQGETTACNDENYHERITISPLKAVA